MKRLLSLLIEEREEMSESKLPQKINAAEIALVTGDLSKLTPQDRLIFYNKVCESLGLNPLTKPFDYVTLKGKLTFYATKNCAEQLRHIKKISIYKIEKEIIDNVLTVTAYAKDAEGKEDSDVGAIDITDLRGQDLANAHMKAVTKAKRRVTLSIAGLGMLDESEATDSRYASHARENKTAQISAAIKDTTTRPEYEEVLMEKDEIDQVIGLDFSEYVFKTGQNRKGKRIADFDSQFLIEALAWYDAEMNNGKSFDAPVIEDFETIRRHLN